MPFRSEAQRRYLFLKHPEIAKRFAHEYPGQKNLPYHVGDRKKKAQRRKHGVTRALNQRSH